MKAEKYLVVVDPACRVPELDCLNNFSRLGVNRMSYHLPALYGMDSLAKIKDEEIGGIIVLGSGACVYDDLDWQDQLIEWLEPKIDKKIPIFGLCYGHQLLAHMLGAKVEFIHEDKFKYRGFRKVSWLGDKRLDKQPGEVSLVVSHREHVIECPKGCFVIAESPEVKIDGFAHKEFPIWALQPHPEATWLFMKNQSIDVEYDDGSFEDGHSIVKSFLTYCQLV